MAAIRAVEVTMPSHGRVLVWLRRDLRLADNRALAEACSFAQEVVPVFVYDTTILNDVLDRDDRRVTFIHASIDELDHDLALLNKGIVTIYGDPIEEIPRLAALVGAEAVFCSHDDEPYALRRDDAVAKRLGAIALHSVKDHVIFERREILNGSGEPFRVYTPYARAWRARFVAERDAVNCEPDLRRLSDRSKLPKSILGNRTLDQIDFRANQPMFQPGESGAKSQLKAFLSRIDEYPVQRNIPADDDTSGLSIHLRFGTISIRECIRGALECQSGGADKWLGELIWRDFYQMILANFPRVAAGRAFNEAYNDIKWPGSRDHFQAWCDGRTGYPLVDAAMRCFAATGWMHNRNRMIVASFLVKDLLVDWREGEAFFARHLLDFELASNNGNWQWAAGTGVDAQPYFRIFNPVLQSRKFDPDGRFIRAWCPELKDFDSKSIHEPWRTSAFEQAAAGCVVGVDYPEPIVDHATQKPLAISLFKTL